MPNWCYTNITIKSKDETKAKELHELIEKWTSGEPFKKNDWNNNWLGNIVGYAGLDTWLEDRERQDFATLRCRGGILDHYIKGSDIHITTETAWGPMLKMWQRLIDRYLPDAELYYSAEEPGNLLFCTNEPEMEGRYYIDIYEPCDKLDSIDSDCEATEEWAVEVLQQILDSEETDIDKLLAEFEESEYTENISFNKWKFEDASNFD